jgi:hypothetical protein
MDACPHCGGPLTTGPNRKFDHAQIIARVLAGEKVATLNREFGLNRDTIPSMFLRRFGMRPRAYRQAAMRAAKEKEHG